MKTKPKITVTLGILIGIFILLVSFFVVPMPDEIRRPLFLVATVLGLAFFILGVVLIVMTVKQKVKGKLKWFLILTGASSATVLPGAILHNLVYALFIYLFGEGFWERSGLGDEPFFFILALVISPIVFLVGSIGSVILLSKKN